MTLIYLAHPVDMGKPEYADAYAQASLMLEKFNAVVYHPSKAWSYQCGVRSALQRGNLAVLNVADGVLAVWPHDVVSVGTPIEILIAIQGGKRVALITSIENSWILSWLVEASANHLMLFELDDPTSYQEAAQWLMA